MASSRMAGRKISCDLGRQSERASVHQASLALPCGVLATVSDCVMPGSLFSEDKIQRPASSHMRTDRAQVGEEGRIEATRLLQHVAQVGETVPGMHLFD